MTRKHFKLFAEALMLSRPINNTARIQWAQDRMFIVNALSQLNPRLNSVKFYDATEA